MRSSPPAISPTGSSPTSCRCASRCSCTKCSGATSVGASRSVVLLSGGLDSATALAIARARGDECRTLAIDYGQRHRAELAAARRVSAALGAIEYRELRVDIGALGGSALTDTRIAVPERGGDGIPVTYVPARTTIFLSLALAWAEWLGAGTIVIGVNAIDYSGYPDCRPEFIAAFERLANLATNRAVARGDTRTD